VQHDPEPTWVRVAVVAGHEEVLRTRRLDCDEEPRVVATHGQAVRHILGKRRVGPGFYIDPLLADERGDRTVENVARLVFARVGVDRRLVAGAQPPFHDCPVAAGETLPGAGRQRGIVLDLVGELGGLAHAKRSETFMAESTSRGNGGGCMKTEQVAPDRPVGDDWSSVVENIRKSAAKQARAHLEKQEYEPGEGEVEVRIQMAAFVRFPHRGREVNDAEGLFGCVCTNDGEVSVCTGQCDFDACCDWAPMPGPIVVVP
jgi:hypothetical protein